SEQRRGGPVDEGSAHRRILASHADGGAVPEIGANCIHPVRRPLDPPCPAPLGLLLHRARGASRSKSGTEAVRGSGRSTGRVDESATGSVSFFGPAHSSAAPPALAAVFSARYCLDRAPAHAEHPPRRSVVSLVRPLLPGALLRHARGRRRPRDVVPRLARQRVPDLSVRPYARRLVPVSEQARCGGDYSRESP